MKWNVVQLQKFRNDSVEIEQTVDVKEDLKSKDPNIRDVSPIHVKGEAVVDSKKVTFHLHINGTLTLPCSRTLADVKYPIDIQSTETFILNPTEYNLDNLDEIHEPEGGVINLLPIVEELILLEIPIQVFSEEALRNEGLQKGQDWEVMTEDQYQLEQQKNNKIDPRLQGLRSLLEEKNNDQH